ncbi:MAG: hydantoinase/oxoprolinase family protein [Minwuia sp.]|uniref:hydantoinase/oxoprolinase family protein n=1 Tax=Minwuia sp. TaxID=2493630 RepID=UPI003A83B0AA
MRFAVDTGGTFTDLLVEQSDGRLNMFKAATTPDDPIRGVIDSLQVAADHFQRPLADLLEEGTLFIHGTTRAINAIITGATAKTAFLTTAGHPDILVLREGGRSDVFNFTVPYPDPYVPRSLTFEIDERIGADGSVLTELNEAQVIETIGKLKAAGVEAVAVCLLWSIVNGKHEARIGELLEEHLPGVPYTLSNRLNPSLREYRRASSTAIDASLKPLMGAYMRNLQGRLSEAGFGGRVLIVTSGAGVIDAADAAEMPVHLINSGPSMAPVAGRHFADVDAKAETAIVADTGGTTYDLSLVRRGRIPWTRETWVGGEYRGHMTGFPSVDVRSIGAGGGSIAWVDDGGLLHVGPQSAQAVPGPAAYGQGGQEPTLTDACVTLGYVDPDYFLGGAMRLDREAAKRAIEKKVSSRLGISVEDAAIAIVQVATENMVQAIMDITVNQGIDPAKAVLIGGGGAAGLNSERIGQRLNCPMVLIPDVGAGLSAAGALMSELISDARATHYTTTDKFDIEGVNAVLAELKAQCEAFAEGPGEGATETTIGFTAEARYPSQVWEIEVPLRGDSFASEADVRNLVADFHAAHDEVFAISDPDSEVEIIGWSARVSCRLRKGHLSSLSDQSAGTGNAARRFAYFKDAGWTDAAIHSFDELTAGDEIDGPAIVESSFTTVVVGPGAKVSRKSSGSLAIVPAAT